MMFRPGAGCRGPIQIEAEPMATNVPYLIHVTNLPGIAR